jgi:AraC family transcriptional regulator
MTMAIEGAAIERAAIKEAAEASLGLGAEPRRLHLPPDRRALEQDHLFGGGQRGHRVATLVAHRAAVERVVDAMRTRLDAPFSLGAMARLALISPYHFNRVFRSMTGIPPQSFLTALRMQAAKKLLLTTELRVTDVCFSVGYQSIGTFSSRFKELVGMTPRRFREASEDRMRNLLGVLAADNDEAEAAPDPQGFAEVSGHVCDSGSPGGPTFVGLFEAGCPGGQPAACALLTGPDRYRLRRVPDGRYRVMAAAFAWSWNIRDYLLPEDSSLWVGISRDPVEVRCGRVSGDTNVTLRRKQAIDPPLVMTFPSSAPAGRRAAAVAPSSPAGGGR